MQAQLRQIFEENVPFNRVLGLKVELIDPDAPKLRFDMRPELIGNPRRQILHGGVISAVLDVAAGFAVYLAVSKNRIENPDASRLPVHRHDRSARRLSAARPRQAISSPPAAWCGSATASRSRTPSWRTMRAS